MSLAKGSLMTGFTPHSTDTAPEGSKPILGDVQKGFGFVPDLMRVMAESPAPAACGYSARAQPAVV